MVGSSCMKQVSFRVLFCSDSGKVCGDQINKIHRAQKSNTHKSETLISLYDNCSERQAHNEVREASCRRNGCSIDSAEHTKRVFTWGLLACPDDIVGGVLRAYASYPKTNAAAHKIMPLPCTIMHGATALLKGTTLSVPPFSATVTA